MTVTTAMIDGLMEQSREVARTLACDPVLQPYVDADSPVPRPFCGSGEIRLVIIGQDPTVENKNTRKKVTTALMLNCYGHLARFLSEVCAMLGATLENVYATNVCKNFFKQTPTRIEKNDRVDVIGLTASYWLPVLRQELAWFAEATVISLGEPVLQGLVRPGFPQDVKSYWGYRQGWSSQGFEPFRPVGAGQSTIERSFFPFVHLNTKDKTFYSTRWDDCLAFIRDLMREEVRT